MKPPSLRRVNATMTGTMAKPCLVQQFEWVHAASLFDLVEKKTVITNHAITSNEYPELRPASMRKIHASVINVSYAEVRLYKICDPAQVIS
jgi:hypothetical protein